MPSSARHRINKDTHSSLVRVGMYSHDCSTRVWHRTYCELKMNFSSFRDSFFVRNGGGVCSCLAGRVGGSVAAAAAHRAGGSGKAAAVRVLPGLLHPPLRQPRAVSSM